MKIRTVEFEMEGLDIIATAEFIEASDELYELNYDVKCSDDESPSIDEQLHDTIMDYAYYLLKDDDAVNELHF